MRVKNLCALILCMSLLGGGSLFAAGQEEGGGSAEGVVTLQAWINDFNPDSKKLVSEKLIPQFEEDNPGIKIEMQFVGWGNHSEKYLTAWAGGEVPDIFEPALEQAAEMIAKEQAAMLDSYVAGWGEIGDFYPVGYKPYMQGEHYYSIPFRLDVRNIYYRKDLFEEAGLDPEQPPQNWDDLKMMTEKLTIRDGQKMVQEGFNVEIGNFGAQEFVEFVWQNGGEVLNETQDASLLTSPEVVEALEYLTELYNIVRPAGTAQLPESPIPYFATGQRAMQYGTAGSFREVRRYAPDKLEQVGIALPLMKEKRVNNVFGGGFSISSVSEYPDQAWKFIEYFVSTEIQATHCEILGQLPSRKSAVEYEFFQHPVLQKALDSAQYGKIYIIIPAWWEMLSRLGDQLELSYNKKKSPAEALQDAHDAWNEILARENQ